MADGVDAEVAPAPALSQSQGDGCIVREQQEPLVVLAGNAFWVADGHSISALARPGIRPIAT